MRPMRVADSVLGDQAHHQLAVTYAHVQFLADGEAQFLHPAAGQAQCGHALAVGGMAAADGTVLRRARAARGALLAGKIGGVGRGAVRASAWGRARTRRWSSSGSRLPCALHACAQGRDGMTVDAWRSPP